MQTKEEQQDREFLAYLKAVKLPVTDAALFIAAMNRLAGRKGKRLVLQMHTATNHARVPVMALAGDDAADLSWIGMAPYIRGVQDGQDPDAAAEEAAEELDARNKFRTPDTFEDAAPYLRCRLVSYQANRTGLLADAVFVRKLDFAAVPYLERDGLCTPAISRKTAARWNMTPEDITSRALRETARAYPPRLVPIREILAKMGYPLAEEEDTYPLYLLGAGPFDTDGCGNPFGAVAAVIPEALAMAGDELQSDFYLFPSSQSEVILLPIRKLTEPESPDALRRMVADINQRKVPPELVLTNSLYICRRGGELALV